MFRTKMTWMLSVVCLLVVVFSAAGQVVIRAPFVRVAIGPPTASPGPYVVASPAAPVSTQPAAQQPLPAPIVSTPAPAIPIGPQPGLEIAPPPQPLAPPRPLTLQEFARLFVPKAGTHEVVLLHPVQNKAMTVVFNLPPGNPAVRLSKRELRFDYGNHREVQISFPVGGSVRVESR